MTLCTNWNFYRFAAVIFLAMCFMNPVFGQLRGGAISNDSTDAGLGGGNTISGLVMSPTGRPVETRVRVRLNTMTRGDVTTVTDERGRFTFRGLVSGDYSVVIDNEKEFEPITQAVTVLQLRGSPGQEYMLQVRLKLKPSTDGKAEVVDAEFVNVPKNALDIYKKAIELAKTGDHKGAIEQLTLATAEYSKFMLAFNEIGVQYAQLKEYAKADEAFQEALKIEPEAFLPLRNRGIILVCLNRFTDAEPVLRKALKINDKSSTGHFYLAQAVANQNRFDEGEKEFLAAIKFGDEVKEAHRYLAIIYAARGDKKRELAELETYLRLAPAAPDAEQLRKLIQQLKSNE